MVLGPRRQGEGKVQAVRGLDRASHSLDRPLDRVNPVPMVVVLDRAADRSRFGDRTQQPSPDPGGEPKPFSRSTESGRSVAQSRSRT